MSTSNSAFPEAMGSDPKRGATRRLWQRVKTKCSGTDSSLGQHKAVRRCNITKSKAELQDYSEEGEDPRALLESWLSDRSAERQVIAASSEQLVTGNDEREREVAERFGGISAAQLEGPRIHVARELGPRQANPSTSCWYCLDSRVIGIQGAWRRCPLCAWSGSTSRLSTNSSTRTTSSSVPETFNSLTPDLSSSSSSRSSSSSTPVAKTSLSALVESSTGANVSACHCLLCSITIPSPADNASSADLTAGRGGRHGLSEHPLFADEVSCRTLLARKKRTERRSINDTKIPIESRKRAMPKAASYHASPAGSVYLDVPEFPDYMLRVEATPKLTSSCLICLEELPIAAFPVLVTETCEHDEDVCSECLSQSVDSQIEAQFWDQLKCPICSKALDYDAVRRHASKRTFERYDNMATRQCLTNLTGWWECPQPGCGFGGEYRDLESAPLVACRACSYQACFRCEVAWHKGLSCQKYQEEQRRSVEREAEKKDEEMAAEEKVKTTTKACPGKGCGVRIEKSTGCHHMRCSRCQHQFCYDCLSDWKKILKEGNDAHVSSCRWHSKNIKSRPGDADYAADIARVHNGR